jgi:hypothetical protein
MYIEYKGTVPKRCLHCGGLMIAGERHECITSDGWNSNSITKQNTEIDNRVVDKVHCYELIDDGWRFLIHFKAGNKVSTIAEFYDVTFAMHYMKALRELPIDWTP